MKKFGLLLLVLLTVKQAFSQDLLMSQADQQLDSIIHLTPVFGKVTIISLSDHTVHVDTVDLKKYKFLKNDSAIVITLKDKTEKYIKQGNFWGMTTDYAERRRFYNGQPLTLWRIDAPYVYKAKSGITTFYFFSETLTGTVYPLTNDLIEKKISNRKTKNELYVYLENEHISTDNVNKQISYEFLFAISDALITFTFEFGAVILEGFLNSLFK